jgi:hypothetical protein
MAVDVETLKPYQQKLFKFIAEVAEGVEVKSGEPSKPDMLPRDYEALKVQDAELKKNTPPGSVFKNNKLFATLAGMSHQQLLSTWTTDPTFTTCNGLLGTCATAMGVNTLKAFDMPGGKSSTLSLGQFEIATILASRGLSNAWVANANGARPRYGDIFRAEEYHMGVSLDFDGDNWNTIESGQGGRHTGHDILKRKSQKWGLRSILGWVDVETLLADKAMLPSWIGGWWRVTELGQEYYYYFSSDFLVYCQSRPPTSTLFPPPPSQANFYGSFSIVTKKYQTAEIRWFTDDPDETFQVSTSTAKVPGTKDLRDASKDTMKGVCFGGKPMSASRLPGPWQTGLTYAQSHPNGGSGDSTAHR